MRYSQSIWKPKKRKYKSEKSKLKLTYPATGDKNAKKGSTIKWLLGLRRVLKIEIINTKKENSFIIASFRDNKENTTRIDQRKKNIFII